MSDDALRGLLNSSIPLPRGDRTAAAPPPPLVFDEEDEAPRLEIKAGAITFAGLSLALCALLAVAVATGSLFSKLPFILLALMGVVVPARLIERAILAPPPLRTAPEGLERGVGDSSDPDQPRGLAGTSHQDAGDRRNVGISRERATQRGLSGQAPSVPEGEVNEST